MIKLYEFSNSVCCQKVRVTLAIKNLSWESVSINLFTSEQYSPEYLKINPKGVVPALQHEEKIITESTLICEYIDEVFPHPLLVPSDPLKKTEMRAWSKHVDEGLHEGVSEISFSAMFREKMKSMTEEQRQIRFENIGDPKRRDRFKSTYELGVKSPFVLYAVNAYKKAFEQMEAQLSRSQNWLLGSEITLADINMMPYVARLSYLNLLDIWIKDKPNIKDWWSKAKLNPAFKKGISDRMNQNEIDDMHHFGTLIKPEVIKLFENLV